MLKKFGICLVILLICFGFITGVAMATDDTDVNDEESVVVSNDGTAAIETSNSSNGIGLIAAALAVGLSAIGSGIAVAVVASSAVGAISENPNLLGKAVIFAGLAEGIAIYGLIISIMILSKI